MSLVGRLAGDAKRLGDLLPGPAFVNRTFHCLALHAIGQAAKSDDCCDRGRGLIRCGSHAVTVPDHDLPVNLD